MCHHYPSSTLDPQSHSRDPPQHNHVFSDEHLHSHSNRGIIYITSAALSSHPHSSIVPACLATRGIVHNITSAALSNHPHSSLASTRLSYLDISHNITSAVSSNLLTHKLSRHTCRRFPCHYTTLLLSKCTTSHPVSLCHHYPPSTLEHQSKSRYPPQHNHVLSDEHLHSLFNRGTTYITSAALSSHPHSSIVPACLATRGTAHNITSAALSNHLHSSIASTRPSYLDISHNITSTASSNHLYSQKLSRRICRLPCHYTTLQLFSKCTKHPVSLCHHYHSSTSGQQSQSRDPSQHHHVFSDEHLHNLSNRLHRTAVLGASNIQTTIALSDLTPIRDCPSLGLCTLIIHDFITNSSPPHTPTVVLGDISPVCTAIIHCTPSATNFSPSVFASPPTHRQCHRIATSKRTKISIRGTDSPCKTARDLQARSSVINP